MHNRWEKRAALCTMASTRTIQRFTPGKKIAQIGCNSLLTGLSCLSRPTYLSRLIGRENSVQIYIERKSNLKNITTGKGFFYIVNGFNRASREVPPFYWSAGATTTTRCIHWSSISFVQVLLLGSLARAQHTSPPVTITSGCDLEWFFEWIIPFHSTVSCFHKKYI